MQELSIVLTSLSITAGLAMSVERTLEVLKHLIQNENELSNDCIPHIISRANNAINLTKQAFSNIDSSSTSLVADKSRFDNTVNKNTVFEKTSTTILSAADHESDELHPPPEIQVLPATPQSQFKSTKIVFLQLAAAGLGMILAYIFDLRLLSIFMEGYGVAASATFLAIDPIITGLIIGGGSQPVHLLIRFLIEHKIDIPDDTPQQKQLVSNNSDSSTVAVNHIKEASPSVWTDIDYRGGINPASLENTHLRPGNPSLIVYHHTAMASSTSFQDIVDEFLVAKKWLTGYHCVVMPDGAIRPFCRWDRSGNHAKGNNARSLGLSFHGNFHTEPGDKYSNADGRYGNKAPTQAQLRAGARVIALWLYLYGNSFDSVMSHQQIMPKGYTVCPGSNFPEEQLMQLVRNFYDSWTESNIAQKAITTFKKQKYIYV